MQEGMTDSLFLVATIAQALDGLGIAVCAFDGEDRTLLWNRTFLTFFPEHAGHVHAGEPYCNNLRRFYECRLSAEEFPRIEKYIAEGVARHRAQQRPFTFEHRGVQLHVASLPLAGIGRIRVWKRESCSNALADVTPRLPDIDAERRLIESFELVAHLADSVMVSTAAGVITWVNEAFVVMYGLRNRTAAVGSSFETVYRTAWKGSRVADDSPFEAGLSTLVENMRFVGAPFEVPLPGGRWTRMTHQRGPDGTSFSTHVDITPLKRQQQEMLMAERRSRESNALLVATLERMQQGVMMVNAQRIVEVCNRRAIELLGLPESLMATKPSFEEVLAYQWSTNEFCHTSEDLQAFVRSGGIIDQPQSYERMRPDGKVIEVQSVPIAGGGVLRTYTDISERKRSEDRIRHMARHDGLTSLVNRTVFVESLNAAFLDSGVVGDSFAVHYIDLDRFKPINDRHGHALGDKVLATVAQRMRRVARENDVIARMGGDEFAVLQRGVGDIKEAFGLAERILTSLRRPMEIESLRIEVGASIGIATYPGPAANVDMLLRQADCAMYAAKSSGSDSIRAFSDGMSIVERR